MELRQPSGPPRDLPEHLARLGAPRTPTRAVNGTPARSAESAGAVNRASVAFSYYPRLARVLTFVDLNMSRPLSLKDAAGVACLERKYFSAFFRKKVGVGFREWLRQRRVHYGAMLIGEHDESLARIAHQVGVGNLRSFERAFK